MTKVKLADLVPVDTILRAVTNMCKCRDCRTKASFAYDLTMNWEFRQWRRLYLAEGETTIRIYVSPDVDFKRFGLEITMARLSVEEALHFPQVERSNLWLEQHGFIEGLRLLPWGANHVIELVDE